MSDLSTIDGWFEGRSVITSSTHPIRVDFLPPELHQLPGKLGMTIAPGKCNIGLHAIWERDLEADLCRLKQEYQIEILVTLLETNEFAKLRIPDFFDRVQAHHMESWHFPIQDFGTPTHTTGLVELVDRILVALQDGKILVIHCKAGLGRTGLVTAACLIALGYTIDEAFTHVRAARPGSIETLEQEAYAHEFAEAWFQASESARVAPDRSGRLRPPIDPISKRELSE